MTIMFAIKRSMIVHDHFVEIAHPLGQTEKTIMNYHVEFEHVQTARYLVIVDDSE